MALNGEYKLIKVSCKGIEIMKIILVSSVGRLEVSLYETSCDRVIAIVATYLLGKEQYTQIDTWRIEGEDIENGSLYGIAYELLNSEIVDTTIYKLYYKLKRKGIIIKEIEEGWMGCRRGCILVPDIFEI